MPNDGVLMRIFGSETDEIIGGWRQRRNDELNKLYFTPNIITNDQIKRMGLV
jgi:hypothetical protein